ncbi:MAG: carboxypeptidase regulatory-like domain-containing protein [Bryobacteraceae bacterium]|nr:carboxypeptidase regulatory-like domain-containing protein [Bryobacteraceae bacterium]
MKRVLLLLASFAAAAIAQQDMGVITGVITDSSGASIPGARVTATQQNTGEKRELASSETGTYTIGPIRIGTWDVTVEKDGFRRAIWTGIELHAQDRVRADLQLQVGQTSDTISVTAEAPLLQAETSSLAHVVQEREIKGLPLNGRNFQQLAWLTAGVSPATQGRDRESGFNAHGQPMTQNSFLVDGIDNNNNVMGMQDRKMQVVVPSLDAVAEFKVQTSNYSAEFGRNSGAVMIVNIKSGTNQLHGSAYEYVRNDRFDARDMFSYVDRTGDGKADPEVLKQNQFGATLGGPILRNKLFFFGSWERRTERRSQSDTAIVPTDNERQGIFATSLRTINDPQTGRPFPDNRIPASRFDPTSAKIVSLWPQANFSGFGTRSNYINNPPWTTDRDAVDIRSDYSMTSKDTMFGRVSLSPYTNLRAGVFPGPARGDAGNDRAIDDNKGYSAAYSWSHIFRPNLLNEFRYGFNRQLVNKRELTDESTEALTKQYGISGIPPNGQLFGLPRITLNGGIGYTGLGEPGSMPNFKISQVHQWLDNVSWNRGNHNFRFGADLRWNRSDIFGGASSHGSFQFNGNFTGVSLADFLLGLSSQANLTTQLYGQMRFRNYMFYALDDWKLSPRLTLNIGLRYELATPWFDKYDNMNRLELEDRSRFNQITKAGYCGSGWSCRGLVNTDTNNWAPRVGLSYQAFRRTVLRAAFGSFYGGQGSLGADQRGINNFPYNRNVTVLSTATRPALQLSAGFPAGFLGDPGGAPPRNLNWSTWQTDFPAPTIHQWNAAIQQELRSGLALTVAYVGSSSSYIMGDYNWNGAPPGPVATEVQRRPLPEWNTISFRTPYGHASYHGLDVQLERRYANGLSFTAAWNWSHSLDNIAEQFGQGNGSVQDSANFRGSRASSDFDLRHRVVSAMVYELPVGKGKAWMNRGGVLNQVLGGWQLSVLPSWQTGQVFTVTLANARQRLGATSVGDWRPDLIRNPKLENPTPDRWFDTSAFVLPLNADGTFRFGNAPRSVGRTAPVFNLDSGLMKNFAVTERVRVQFRWEVFNATNTPSLGDPNANFDSPDFGKVRGTVSTPRQMQFALRVSF